MGRSIWDRLFRRVGAQQADRLPDELGNLIKAARPVPPDLTEGRANYMLARALSESRVPHHGGIGHFTVVTRLALTGCAMAAALLFARTATDRLIPGQAIAPLVHRPERIAEKIVPIGPERSTVTPAIGPGKSSQRRRFITRRGKQRRTSWNRFWTARSVPAHLSAGMEKTGRAESRLPTDLTEPLMVALDTTPRAADAHLVVIVSGHAQPRLDVEVTTGGPAHTGFAKASAYRSVGPGGGILTQCTIHEGSGEDEAADTAQYSIVYGMPVSRLRSETPLAADKWLPDEKGLNP